MEGQVLRWSPGLPLTLRSLWSGPLSLALGPCRRMYMLPRSTGPATQAGAPFPLEQACQTRVYEACAPWATSLTCLL